MTAVAQEKRCQASVGELFFEHPTKFIAALDAPKGVRVEYIEGTYYVAPPAGDQHNNWAGLIYSALLTSGEHLARTTNGFCAEPPGAKHVTGAFIPDFLVLSRTPTDADENYRHAHDGWYPSDMLRLVGEITSPSNHRIDREEKYRTYARAMIPVYVLIDRQRQLAIAFSDPVDEGADDSHYKTEVRVKIGDVLALPDGLPPLDTSVLT
ncbi:Uma2 family endonuclease [Yinghuangia sp. YIM S10712]|uniref:Uma2 family endonuclease n=1 Tax=Yinghuangia sp. YIM S10712 TaxID=3436930 RepID=UPI003F53A2CD